MAKNDNTARPSICESCGKELPPGQLGYSTDCVWRDGKTLCIECNRKVAKEGR